MEGNMPTPFLELIASQKQIIRETVEACQFTTYAYNNRVWNLRLRALVRNSLN